MGVMIGLGLFLTAILVIIQKGTIILSTSRFPIFIIGCMTGYAFVNKIELKKTAVICSISLLFMILQIFLVNNLDRIFLWRNAISWLPFIVITPGLCFMICYIFNKINLKNSNILTLMGKLSLEAYLVHVICLRYLKDWYGSIIEGSTIKLWIAFILFFLLTLAISYILHRAFDKLKLIIKI